MHRNETGPSPRSPGRRCCRSICRPAAVGSCGVAMRDGRAGRTSNRDLCSVYKSMTPSGAVSWVSDFQSSRINLEGKRGRQTACLNHIRDRDGMSTMEMTESLTPCNNAQPISREADLSHFLREKSGTNTLLMRNSTALYCGQPGVSACMSSRRRCGVLENKFAS